MSETIKEEAAEAVQAEPQGLTLDKFEEATEVVSKVISETKLVYSEYFSKDTKYTGYLKEYKDAASSRTRSASQKNNRMNALLKYCDINEAAKN